MFLGQWDGATNVMNFSPTFVSMHPVYIHLRTEESEMTNYGQATNANDILDR